MLSDKIMKEVKKEMVNVSILKDNKDNLNFRTKGKSKNSKTFVISRDSEALVFLKLIKKANKESINLYESESSTSFDYIEIPNEFENLLFLKEKGLHLKKMIPEPFFFIENYNCIGMQLVEGDLLIDKLKLRSLIKNLSKTSIAEDLQSVSDYIVEFEKNIYLGNHKELDPFVDRIINKELASIKSLSASQKSIIINYILSISNNIDQLPVHFVSTDFKAHNIIINNSVTGIDWGMCKYNGFVSWMASSFIRSVKAIDTLSIYDKSLQDNFINNYKKKSIFGDKYLHISQLFDSIISFAGISNNKKLARFHMKYIENLIGKKLL